MVIIRTVLFEPCKGVMQLLPILSYVQHYKKYHAARFEAASVQYGLNQLEIDILLFLHNNPDCRTASDICRYRGLAKSNVSAAVERLRTRGVLTVSPCAGQPPPAAAGLCARCPADGRGTGGHPALQLGAAVCGLYGAGAADAAGLSAPHGCKPPAGAEQVVRI